MQRHELESLPLGITANPLDCDQTHIHSILALIRPHCEVGIGWYGADIIEGRWKEEHHMVDDRNIRSNTWKIPDKA